MTSVRVLNEEGVRHFQEFLAAARSGSTELAPTEILTDGRYSEQFPTEIVLTNQEFPDAFALGEYLTTAFSVCGARDISRNHALWSWLALFFFETICPASNEGRRKVLEDAVYVLGPTYIFNRYYRHAVRTPWQAVRVHGSIAKILLLTSGRGTRTEFAEQLGAYADIFGCTNVITAAYRLWFDEETQRPKKGSSGKGPGSPRRLATVVRQLQLTYDLSDCPLPDFLNLLPTEFDKWKSDNA